MPNYEYKRISLDLLADIQYLYKHIFNQSFPISFFEKKYNTDAFGLSYVGYIAYADDGTPAAYYGVFPCNVMLNDKKYLAAQSGDTMTHPAHRGQGLFISLAKQTFQLAKDNDVKFIFGFPNENSYPGFVKKLEWQHNENLNSYHIKVATLPFSAISKKVKVLAPIYKTYIRFVLLFFRTNKTSFNNSCIKNEYGGVVHNDIFWGYKKYFKNYLVKNKTTTAWIGIDGDLKVGDMEINDIYANPIPFIKQIAFFLGCNKIVFNVSPDTYWDNILKDKYDCKEGLPIGYLDLEKSNIDISKFKFVGSDFDTF
jgi:hypothetical protein